MRTYDKKISFSEIILYHIVIYKPKLFGLFKSSLIEYIISYSIADDRINYKKIERGKIIDEHHTKNNYDDSMSIMKGIKERYERIYPSEIKRGKIVFKYHIYGQTEDERMRLRTIKSLLITKMNKLSEKTTFIK